MKSTKNFFHEKKVLTFCQKVFSYKYESFFTLVVRNIPNKNNDEKSLLMKVFSLYILT